VTIAVGVLAQGGAVVAADREETFGDYAKLDQLKVRLAPYTSEREPVYPLIVGSGFGIYADAFVQYLKRRSRQEALKGPVEPGDTLQLALTEFFRDHVEPFAHYPYAERPYFEVLVVHPQAEGARLFQTTYNVAYEPDRYAVIGAGVTAARSVLDPLVKQGGFFSIEDTALIAMYAVLRAKDTIPGCGKQTDLFVVRGRGMERLPPGGEDKIDSLLRRIPDDIDPAVFQVVIGCRPIERVSKAIAKLTERFEELRSELSLERRRPTSS
jgi:20S proteasome alpha/beta subunit